MDKVVKLLPHRWVKIGRSPHSTLLLNNTGVSRDHCSVRWDPYTKKVELKLELKAATLVNGQEVTGKERVELQHADRIRIVGKGKMFDFVIDKRPVNLAIANPVDAAEEDERLRVRPKHQRALLQKRLIKLDQALREVDAKVADAEREYTQTQTRRSSRELEKAAKEEQYKFYIEDSSRLERHLEESRHDWLKKLEAEHKANEDRIQPIIDATAELQDKVEKLQLKKDEIAREFHPEMYAVADVAVMNLQSPDASSEMPSAKHDSDDEEDAFAGLPQLREAKAEEVAEPAEAKRPAEAAALPDDGGDAKRPRLDGETDAAPELMGTVLD